MKWFFNRPPSRVRLQTEMVFKAAVLSNLDPLERYEFIQLCHRRTFRKGEFIYHQNDPATGLYLIESGNVEFIDPSGTEMEPATQSFKLSQTQSFGLLSLAADTRRLFSAKAADDAVLLGFYKSDFATLKQRHPLIAIKLMETVTVATARHLEKALKKVHEANLATPEQRFELEAFFFDDYDLHTDSTDL